MIKEMFKRLAARMGYNIRSTRYIPRPFIINTHVLKLTLDHVISNHLLQMQNPGQFFFVQVGAFDGIECDPLFKYLERYSWKGIMLEPQPQAFSRLTQLHESRPQLKLVNAAISNREKKSPFYILEGEGLPAWAQGMASFDKQNIIKHKNIIPNIEKQLRETEIDCISFGSLFKQFEVNHVDLLQVDTEGYDAEIIYMFPFDKIRPAIIHFESKHLTKPTLEKLLNYLIDLDYSVAYDGEEDMLAVYNS